MGIHDDDALKREHSEHDEEAVQSRQEKHSEEGSLEGVSEVQRAQQAENHSGCGRVEGEAEGRGGAARSECEQGLTTPSSEAREAQLLVSEANGHAQKFTGQASDRARHLAFTGIGLIWILSGGGISNVDEVKIAGPYTWPLYLLIFALALDFTQYVLLALGWEYVASKRRKIYRNDDISDQEASDQIDGAKPTLARALGHAMFFAKLGLVFVGYGWLLISAANQLL